MGAKRYLGRWMQFMGNYDTCRLLFAEFNKIYFLNRYLRHVTEEDAQKALAHGIKWLIESHGGADAGSRTYYFNSGWTSSYPETTGYIAVTLLDYARNNPEGPWAREAKATAENSLEWLLSIQREDGGWPGGYVDQQRPSVVFNTGQVLRGLWAGYQSDFDPAFKARLKKAASAAVLWIIGELDGMGRFAKSDYKGMVRVYGTYVMAPCLQWSAALEELAPKIREAATRHCNWVRTQQEENYWLNNCDNTAHKNHMPIIHTLAYTAQGLIDCGLLLKDQAILQAGQGVSDRLLDIFMQRGQLHGRYDAQWKGHESFIPTGGAQLAKTWFTLYKSTGEQRYVTGIQQMNKLLTVIALRGAREHGDTLGGVTGSFPLWGRYEPFALPNWATKYFCDTLMNEHYEL